MTAGRILGHIDCPTCGTAQGMRITQDKNGHPFGYCEAECSQQLRIGPDLRRLRKFYARYPWAAGEAAPAPAAPPAADPVPDTVPAPAPKSSTPSTPSTLNKKPATSKPRAADPFAFLMG